MTADPNRTATEIDAMLAWNLAQNRLIHAAALTYGDSGSEVRRINTLDSVALLIAAVPPTAEIDGDSATMVVNIPPAVIAMAPAGLQSVLGQWSNATVYFQKQGEQWRLDIDRSLRVEIKLQLRPPEQVDTAVEIGIMTDNAQEYDRVAGEIENGNLPTPGEAAQALKLAGRMVGAKYGISSMQFTILPAHIAN